MKKAMQSGDNRMKVASKHSFPNKINELVEQTPIPERWGSNTSNSCFIVKLVLITIPNSGLFGSYCE